MRTLPEDNQGHSGRDRPEIVAQRGGLADGRLDLRDEVSQRCLGTSSESEPRSLRPGRRAAPDKLHPPDLGGYRHPEAGSGGKGAALQGGGSIADFLAPHHGLASKAGEVAQPMIEAGVDAVGGT